MPFREGATPSAIDRLEPRIQPFETREWVQEHTHPEERIDRPDGRARRGSRMFVGNGVVPSTRENTARRPEAYVRARRQLDRRSYGSRRNDATRRSSIRRGQSGVSPGSSCLSSGQCPSHVPFGQRPRRGDGNSGPSRTGHPTRNLPLTARGPQPLEDDTERKGPREPNRRSRRRDRTTWRLTSCRSGATASWCSLSSLRVPASRVFPPQPSNPQDPL